MPENLLKKRSGCPSAVEATTKAEAQGAVRGEPGPCPEGSHTAGGPPGGSSGSHGGFEGRH